MMTDQAATLTRPATAARTCPRCGGRGREKGPPPSICGVCHGCETAAKISVACPTEAAIRGFSQMTAEQQNEVLPGISADHSGNSWGMSVRLAWLLIAHPESVAREHGALCSLVGCEDYGCWALEAEARR